MSHATTHPGGKIFERVVDLATLSVAAVLAWTLFVHLHWVDDNHEELIEHFDLGLSAFFAVELMIRFVAEGANPREFMRDKWNVFDTVLLTMALAPLVLTVLQLGGVQSILLRGFRLARVFHGLKHLGHLQLIGRLARVFHGVKHVSHMRLPVIRLPRFLRKID